jgi:hypothetical protein
MVFGVDISFDIHILNYLRKGHFIFVEILHEQSPAKNAELLVYETESLAHSRQHCIEVIGGHILHEALRYFLDDLIDFGVRHRNNGSPIFEQINLLDYFFFVKILDGSISFGD